MENSFKSEQIKKQLLGRRISRDSLDQQLYQFNKNNVLVELRKPAVIGDGIVRLDTNDENKFIETYNSAINSLEVAKFVPASGAASRMFKELLTEYSEVENKNPPDLNQFEYSHKLVENLTRFAFYDELKSICDSMDIKKLLESLLFEPGLNYSNLPKGLIKFHKYKDSSRTAFEEHLVEAREYLGYESGNCNIDFTVPPEYKTDIEEYLEEKLFDYQKDHIKFNLSYSVQNPATDTIAVDMNNNPVKNERGELIFRPAGHGALLENLNAIDSDIIFIKNIDNVTTEKYLHDTVKYKKVLGGYLISIKNQINEILLELESVNKDKLKRIKQFCTDKLEIEIKEETGTEWLMQKLNRPVRVCGVVMNQGEPGGGPFWVNKDGLITKQIVESVQVDMTSNKQKEIWNSSTHFNPVDIVCSVRNYKGEKFDLNNFVDHDACIITKKSIDGKEIRALELPGLWNGAMADWITLFIEVPLITFNPVKTVFDLLREEHQN
ncbi:MAG: DUF4301 family protein [Thermodesulfobacteriota bacterium]